MNITEISVSYEETCSLPGYNNVRPGLRMTAIVEEGETADMVKNRLMKQVRYFVRDEVDQALMDNGKAPKYYEGQRYKIVHSNQRKIILIVPQNHHDFPDDFYNSSSADYDLREITLDQAERYARLGCEQRGDGYRWEVILDGNYSILPPLPVADGLADEGDYPDDMDLDEDKKNPPF